jgi:hypothetical protein
MASQGPSTKGVSAANFWHQAPPVFELRPANASGAPTMGLDLEMIWTYDLSIFEPKLGKIIG